MKPSSFATPALTLALAVAMPSLSNGAIVVTTSKINAAPNDGSPSPFTVSTTDLGQAAGNTNNRSGLFNGNAGTTSSPTNNNPATTLSSGDTVTVTFDTSVNTLGYDITEINSVFGWNPGANGRSNQGYSITLGFVGGGTATLAASTHWEPNSPSVYWTQVNFTNDGGGALESDTINLNGAGATAGTSVTATGVESITFTISNAANAGGVVVAREFDVFGVATVPEPSSTVLLGLGGLGLAFLHRRNG